MKITEKGIVEHNLESMHSSSCVTPNTLDNNAIIRKTRWDNYPPIIQPISKCSLLFFLLLSAGRTKYI